MGATSVQLEHELDARRQALAARVRRLKQRVADDGEAARAQLGAYGHRALGLAGTGVGSETALAQHPRLLVVGAVAAGAAAGLSTSGGEDKPSASPSRPLAFRAAAGAARRSLRVTIPALASAAKAAVAGAIVDRGSDETNDTPRRGESTTSRAQ